MLVDFSTMYFARSSAARVDYRCWIRFSYPSKDNPLNGSRKAFQASDSTDKKWNRVSPDRSGVRNL